MTTIGQNIRKLRKERGMTQEELAAKLALIAELEAIEVSDAEIEAEYERIAGVYNVKAEDVKKMIVSDDIKADLAVAGAMKKVKEYAKANAKASK